MAPSRKRNTGLSKYILSKPTEDEHEPDPDLEAMQPLEPKYSNANGTSLAHRIKYIFSDDLARKELKKSFQRNPMRDMEYHDGYLRDHIFEEVVESIGHTTIGYILHDEVATSYRYDGSWDIMELRCDNLDLWLKSMANVFRVKYGSSDPLFKPEKQWSIKREHSHSHYRQTLISNLLNVIGGPYPAGLTLRKQFEANGELVPRKPLSEMPAFTKDDEVKLLPLEMLEVVSTCPTAYEMVKVMQQRKLICTEHGALDTAPLVPQLLVEEVFFNRAHVILQHHGLYHSWTQGVWTLISPFSQLLFAHAEIPKCTLLSAVIYSMITSIPEYKNLFKDSDVLFNHFPSVHNMFYLLLDLAQDPSTAPVLPRRKEPVRELGTISPMPPKAVKAPAPAPAASTRQPPPVPNSLNSTRMINMLNTNLYEWDIPGYDRSGDVNYITNKDTNVIAIKQLLKDIRKHIKNQEFPAYMPDGPQATQHRWSISKFNQIIADAKAGTLPPGQSIATTGLQLDDLMLLLTLTLTRMYEAGHPRVTGDDQRWDLLAFSKTADFADLEPVGPEDVAARYLDLKDTAWLFELEPKFSERLATVLRGDFNTKYLYEHKPFRDFFTVPDVHAPGVGKPPSHEAVAFMLLLMHTHSWKILSQDQGLIAGSQMAITEARLLKRHSPLDRAGYEAAQAESLVWVVSELAPKYHFCCRAKYFEKLDKFPEPRQFRELYPGGSGATVEALAAGASVSSLEENDKTLRVWGIGTVRIALLPVDEETGRTNVDPEHGGDSDLRFVEVVLHNVLFAPDLPHNVLSHQLLSGRVKSVTHPVLAAKGKTGASAKMEVSRIPVARGKFDVRVPVPGSDGSGTTRMQRVDAFMPAFPAVLDYLRIIEPSYTPSSSISSSTSAPSAAHKVADLGEREHLRILVQARKVGAHGRVLKNLGALTETTDSTPT